MSQLAKRSFDKDLIVLDEAVDDLSFPDRDWESIIQVYEYKSGNFPISAVKCAKIIQEIKRGKLPKHVFAQYGADYGKFKTRYERSKLIIEEVMSRNDITDQDILAIDTCRNDPAFILGQDIVRARAYHFNESTEELRTLALAKFDYWLAYMKEIHKEEFEQKQDQKGVEVTINFGQGILESI